MVWSIWNSKCRKQGWSVRVRFIIVVCLFIPVISSGFLAYEKNKRLRAMSGDVRTFFKGQLFRLEAVDFEKAIGFTPSKEQVELGRLLFNDTILSRNNDTSCATCHLTNHGFSIGVALAFGSLGRGGAHGDNVGARFAEGALSSTRECGDDGFGFLCTAPMFRNVLSTVNVAYRTDRIHDQGLLWDGRFGRLEFQTLLPILTAEELCGSNPVPMAEDENPFRKKGPLFIEGIEIINSHPEDPYRGRNLPFFNSGAQVISGVESFRPDGTNSVPTRNECLAIAIAKIRLVDPYVKLFKEAFGDVPINDVLIGKALASFVATHVSNRTAYDEFADGKDVLTEKQLLGLTAFFGERNKDYRVGTTTIRGQGCNECHSAPLFGGDKFGSLGVRGDRRSIFSAPSTIFKASSIDLQFDGQRGGVPKCHIENVTVSSDGSYAPDLGRANATASSADCFKFRVPGLRNVVETYPYFHHGTMRAQGKRVESFRQLSLEALKQVIRYHTRGPENIEYINRGRVNDLYFDRLYQRDHLVPAERTQFGAGNSDGSFEELREDSLEMSSLLSFISEALFDPDSMRVGELGNDVSHPRSVPSGFHPTITRDSGVQTEWAPGMRTTRPN
jgi:cytochrome c peroxidase